jgi:FkbM family methyltransferase
MINPPARLINICRRKLRAWQSKRFKVVGGVATKQIALGDRKFRVFGSPDDPYFIRLKDEIEQLTRLRQCALAALAPDGIVVDVGANIGITTILLCSLVPQGHVYAFEPSPTNASYLRRNLTANGFSNFTVFECAVGDAAGVLALHTSGASSHVMTEAHLFQSEWPSIQVPVVTIDEALSTLPKIDFIKMDVEGFEPMALAGASATIRKSRPPIFMEFNSWSLYFAHRFDPIDFAKRLWSQFDVFVVDKRGEWVAENDPIRFVHANMTQHGCVDDILLKPRL